MDDWNWRSFWLGMAACLVIMMCIFGSFSLGVEAEKLDRKQCEEAGDGR